MIDEPGGGTRPELPVVLGGRAASGTGARAVPLRTILGSSSRSVSARRLTLGWWGSVAWTVAVLACATSAFAIRDTMFPKLGRTEPPSAWEAPTRPPSSVPYTDREGPVPTGTTIADAAPAAGGTPLDVAPVSSVAVALSSDDGLEPASSAAGTGAKAPVVTAPSVTSPSTGHTVHTTPVPPDVSAPTTSDAVTTTTDPTADDGGGNQRGRSPGGSTGDTVP